MNKIDDILDRLQNQPQPTVDLPDELTDSIMSALPDREAMEPKPRRRYGLYAISAISIAAGIALLLVLRFGNAVEEPRQAHKAQPTVIQAARVAERHLTKSEPTYTAAIETPAITVKKERRKLDVKVRESVKGMPVLAESTPSNADSTAILTARIEAEMQQISDDCYMERLSRTINNDPQLRQLVDDFINETTEEAHSVVYVKQF